MSTKPVISRSFKDFDLPDPLQKAIDDSGYEIPTPIQKLVIPVVLSGKDMLGQAQTGTGKTAAFALPLLSKIDLEKTEPQILVLTPTRELAIQVAEAFKKYGSHLPGLKVLAIYGGSEYGPQLRGLRNGAHVVVGTPGRLIDHITRESLQLSTLTCLVLDEADEMLKMGFKEDVEWVLEHTPANRQIALFSATLPPAIRGIAKKYLKSPEEIIIRNKTSTVELTRQRYWLVSGLNKLDALSRILEVEPFDAVLIFVRTKSATLDIAEQLKLRGFAAAHLNGDILQSQRERTVEQLKSGRLSILIATDVAARGLDLDRISLVINYDIPYDTEAYVHRIGRTGRAGRSGEAILFVAPRENRMLRTIERATRQKIEAMEIPSATAVNAVRVAKFKKQISETLSRQEWTAFRDVMKSYTFETKASPLDVSAALATMFYGDRPFLLPLLSEKPTWPFAETKTRKSSSGIDNRESHRSSKILTKSEKSVKPISEAGQKYGKASHEADTNGTESRYCREDEKLHRARRTRYDSEQEEGKVRFRIEVGRLHGVRPGQIMGAIAGETGIDGKSIGRIKLYQGFSTVDLPNTVTEVMLKKLKRARITGRAMMISRFDPDQADQEMSPPPRSTCREVTKKGRYSQSRTRDKRSFEKPAG